MRIKCNFLAMTGWRRRADRGVFVTLFVLLASQTQPSSEPWLMSPRSWTLPTVCAASLQRPVP
jgi:hypothetical protein